MFITIPTREDKCESFNTDHIQGILSYDDGRLELQFEGRSVTIQFSSAYSAHDFHTAIINGIKDECNTLLIQEMWTDKRKKALRPEHEYDHTFYVPIKSATRERVTRNDPRENIYISYTDDDFDEDGISREILDLDERCDDEDKSYSEEITGVIKVETIKPKIKS